MPPNPTASSPVAITRLTIGPSIAPSIISSPNSRTFAAPIPASASHSSPTAKSAVRSQGRESAAAIPLSFSPASKKSPASPSAFSALEPTASTATPPPRALSPTAQRSPARTPSNSRRKTSSLVAMPFPSSPTSATPPSRAPPATISAISASFSRIRKNKEGEPSLALCINYYLTLGAISSAATFLQSPSAGRSFLAAYAPGGQAASPSLQNRLPPSPRHRRRSAP